MVTIDINRFEAFIFDPDGVITQTASLHARAWQRVLDEFLETRAKQTGAASPHSIPRATIAAMSTGDCASMVS
jgi:beta-phosphoglucomutase-like phosphatase (HAD superfamily)